MLWNSLRPSRTRLLAARSAAGICCIACHALVAWSPRVQAADAPATTAPAATGDFQPYTESIPGTTVKFEMLPIPGGTFTMGSPDSEEGRNPDEGPQHEVQIAPFWMGKHEVTWDEYEIFNFKLDIERRAVTKEVPTDRDKLADALARPTKPYTDMTFGMGKEGYPAICMTQYAAKAYCEWLSAKTGHYYRLPTEAEWEYACRAGTTSAYSFGDDPELLGEYAWYFDNSDDKSHKVGQKKPNPFGLFDMHGNVCEWVLDQHHEDAYAKSPRDNPYFEATRLYPHVVRGGSWDDDPPALRSAARRGSTKDWKIQDPQIPQSRWYHTDALFVGFRVVRPLTEPSEEQKTAYRAAKSDE